MMIVLFPGTEEHYEMMFYANVTCSIDNDSNYKWTRAYWRRDSDWGWSHYLNLVSRIKGCKHIAKHFEHCIWILNSWWCCVDIDWYQWIAYKYLKLRLSWISFNKGQCDLKYLLPFDAIGNANKIINIISVACLSLENFQWDALKSRSDLQRVLSSIVWIISKLFI